MVILLTPYAVAMSSSDGSFPRNFFARICSKIFSYLVGQHARDRAVDAVLQCPSLSGAVVREPYRPADQGRSL